MDSDLGSKERPGERVISLDPDDDATGTGLETNRRPGARHRPANPAPADSSPESNATPDPNERPEPNAPEDRADEFVDATFLGARPRTPEGGWRRRVFDWTGGRINPGPSPGQQQEERLRARIRRPVRGCQRIAVLSRKGGVGKTTVTLCLGHTLASLRSDRVVALDANPDAGTLGYRLADVAGGSITDLVRDGDRIRRYSDARLYTATASSRLEVVPSDDDPAITQAIGAEEYRAAVDVLERHYNIVLTDTGTDITSSVMSGVLTDAHSVVLVVQPSIDGARHSAKTLDWLAANGHEDLVTGAVAVINGLRSHSLVDVERIWAHFAGRVRAVVTVPWDLRLEAGGQVYLDELASDTQRAYARVAGAVMDGLAPLPQLDAEAPTGA